jgi:enoyl-CoA hydratase
MTGTTIRLEKAGAVGRLWLVPPEGKPPTLDGETLDALDAKLEEAESAGGSLRLLEVRSRSPKHFLVGANLRALEKLDAGTIGSWVERGHRVFDRLEGLSLPTVAVVGGNALGGGLELALACDWIVATPRARFAQPEASLGLVPGWGGSDRLARRIGRPAAKELTFTARTIDADEALRIGLVNRLLEEEALESHLRSLGEELGAVSGRALAEAKELIQASGTPGAATREAAASARCFRDGDASGRLARFFAERSKSAG